MGKIKRGILGGFSGKVANVVGSAWKGIAYMKSLPLSVANPKTAAQVAQRTKFANVTEFGSSILSAIIKPLWDRFASQMSGYNDFVRTNINLFEGTWADLPQDLVISKGKMAAPDLYEVLPTNTSLDVVINWSSAAGTGYQLASDKAYAVIVNETQGLVGVSSGVILRSVETLTVTMPGSFLTGDVCRAYLAMLRDDGTIASDTGYVTEVTP